MNKTVSKMKKARFLKPEVANYIIENLDLRLLIGLCLSSSERTVVNQCKAQDISLCNYDALTVIFDFFNMDENNVNFNTINDLLTSY